jgi:hypothetical protein
MELTTDGLGRTRTYNAISNCFTDSVLDQFGYQPLAVLTGLEPANSGVKVLRLYQFAYNTIFETPCKFKKLFFQPR